MSEDTPELEILSSWEEITFATDSENYSLVGLLTSADSGQYIQVVPVNLKAETVVLAIPSNTWGKIWTKRPFVRAEVVKASKVESCQLVHSKGEDCGETKVVVIEVKNAATQSRVIVMDEIQVALAHHFETAEDTLACPSAGPLLELSAATFNDGYATAQGGSPSDEAHLSSRMKTVETALLAIQESLAKLSSAPPTVKKSTLLQGSKRKEVIARPSVAPWPIDPAILAEASQLGIGEDQLAQIAHLLLPAKRFPTESSRAPPKETLLGETEVEDNEDDEIPSDEDKCVGKALLQIGKALEQAVLKPDVLDPMGGTSSGILPLGRAASSSQDLVYLQAAVIDRPVAMYQTIEKRSATANGQRGDAISTSRPCPLFFVEHRSRIEQFQTNAIWATFAATIAKCLQQGRRDEALARALLGVAAAEQFSINRGSWLGAFEIMMMEEPPYHNLARHDAHSSLEPHSRLVDPKWFDAIQSRLKHLDETHERQEKLTKQLRARDPRNRSQKGGGKGKKEDGEA